jgi:hypothetical protein
MPNDSSEEALIGLLAEKEIFTREEVSGRVKAVNKEMINLNSSCIKNYVHLI